MPYRLPIRCGYALAASMLSLHAFAVDPATAHTQALQEAQRQQQLQAQRLQEQLDKDRLSASQPARLTAVAPSVVTSDASSVCKNIHTIEVEGVTLLNSRTVAGVTRHFVDRCLGVQEIETVLSHITRLYIERGWVSVRAYLPQQDLNHGHLKLLVLEGRLSEIRVEDGDAGSISLATTAPGLVGRPLNLRDLEQTLDQINRLASNNATLDMLPGDAPGESIIVISNQPRSPLHLSLGLDNHGAQSTGRTQAGVTLSLDNPLGLNDFVSYTKRSTFPLGSKDRLSESDSVSYSLPWGYSSLSLSASQSRYISSFAAASGGRLQNSGDSTNYALRWDQTLVRNADSRWGVYTNLSTKASHSYLEGTLLTAASRKLSVWDLGTVFNTVWWGGALAGDLSISQGLRQFGALHDGNALMASDPRAQFRKWSLNGNYFKPFKLAGHSLDFSSQWTAQHAKHVLYGTEQIMIGSLYSVRGFSQSSLSGDHGYYVRNEIGTRQAFNAAGVTGSIRPWIGLDHGRVRNRNAGVPEGALTGLAAGVQVNLHNGLTLDIQTSKPLNKPDHLSFEGSQVWLRLGAAI